MERTRVLIIDDHQVVRLGLAAILTDRNGFEVVGESGNGVEGIRLERELHPDVTLLDLLMPEVDGLEATVKIKAQNPDARILILTSYGGQDRIAAIMAAGASGYLLKESSADELMQAIRSIHSGHLILSPKVMQALTDTPRTQTVEQSDLDVLTPREIDVLRGIADGLTNQGIAYQLGISDTTVRSHVSSILSKLNVSNRTQAALIAQERALL